MLKERKREAENERQKASGGKEQGKMRKKLKTGRERKNK